MKMDEKNVLLFTSLWISLFILFMGLSSSVLCLECLGAIDSFLVVLLCALSSFEAGRKCVDVCDKFDKE
tara:strand:- start:146 stop:352 length:207 start_codon:yes stop_codon:yes gene_type:complete